MKKYIDQVKQLKQKPEHVRHRIALGTSVAATVLVGVIWLVGSAANGKFHLTSANQSSDSQQASAQFTDTQSQFAKLVGAAASSLSTSSQPSITVVDGGTTSTVNAAPAPVAPSNATSIPF